MVTPVTARENVNATGARWSVASGRSSPAVECPDSPDESQTARSKADGAAAGWPTGSAWNLFGVARQATSATPARVNPTGSQPSAQASPRREARLHSSITSTVSSAEGALVREPVEAAHDGEPAAFSLRHHQ